MSDLIWFVVTIIVITIITVVASVWLGPVFKRWDEEWKQQEVERTAQEMYARECRAAELAKRLEELRKGGCP